MNDPALTVEIERIRLTGLEIAPERAGRIRTMVEEELRRLLEREGWADGLSGGEVTRLDAPPVQVEVSRNDSHVANGLARSIAQTLRASSDRKGE